MNIDALISILIALLLTAVREGLLVADMQDNTPRSIMLSTWWHRVGAMVRGFLILGIFLMVLPYHGYMDWQLYTWVGIAFLLGGIWYNIAINLITGKKWYYVGKTAWIDRQIRKLFSHINFD